MSIRRVVGTSEIEEKGMGDNYFLEPLVLKAWAYVVPVAATFALLSCLGFFFSRLLFCSLLIFNFLSHGCCHYITDRQFSAHWVSA
jgi:hypothetical protein